MSKTKINTFKLNIVDVMYLVVFKNPCQVKMTLHPGVMLTCSLSLTSAKIGGLGCQQRGNKTLEAPVVLCHYTSVITCEFHITQTHL